jgi:hypothetical protein
MELKFWLPSLLRLQNPRQTKFPKDLFGLVFRYGAMPAFAFVCLEERMPQLTEVSFISFDGLEYGKHFFRY